jgi:ferredoxin-NADP reductase
VNEPPPIVIPPIGPWQFATVTDIRDETAEVKTFTLQLRRPMAHLAGQHVMVRLTAPDGYSARRSYSIASPPSDGSSIDLTVEQLPDGEVSTHLHDDLHVGDALEVRGPIGGWFIWDGSSPALLIAGGSGIVPLMAMLRLARRRPQQTQVHLLAAARDPSRLIYASQLHGSDATVLFTREAPPDHARRPGRLNSNDLVNHLQSDATVFICGSTGFASAASNLAVDAGFDVRSIRVERYGPTT